MTASARWPLHWLISTQVVLRTPDRFKNTLRIMRRDNSCFDFGSWGVALADAKKRLRLVNVILMNASVRRTVPAGLRTLIKLGRRLPVIAKGRRRASRASR